MLPIRNAVLTEILSEAAVMTFAKKDTSNRPVWSLQAKRANEQRSGRAKQDKLCSPRPPAQASAPGLMVTSNFVSRFK